MKHHYYLLSTQVVYTKDKLERSRNFNILVISKEPRVTRAQLGRAQQQAQVRFFTEFDTEHKSKVTDVFIIAVNYLGEMTEAQFHEGFELPSQANGEAQKENQEEEVSLDVSKNEPEKETEEVDNDAPERS